MKQIVLYLMNKKGKNVIESILSTFGADIVYGVYVGRDENVKDDYSYKIKTICVEHSIRILNNSKHLRDFHGLRFAIGWRKMIHDTINLIILHDSLLPKYRGFSPIPNMLIKEESLLGVTALYASDEYDTGDIIYQSSVNISYPIKIEDAINIVAKLYSELILKIIKDYINEIPLPRVSQNDSSATYSVWRDQDDYYIDWSKSASYICRFIDSVGYPYLGAMTTIGEKKLIIEDAEVYPIRVEIVSPGKVIKLKDSMPIVLCGENAVMIKKAYYDTGENLLPLKSFRTRFGP